LPRIGRSASKTPAGAAARPSIKPTWPPTQRQSLDVGETIGTFAPRGGYLIQIIQKLEFRVTHEDSVTLEPVVRRDLNILGSSLCRVFPLPVADEFDELLKQIIYKADRRDRGVGLPSAGLQSTWPRTETGLPSSTGGLTLSACCRSGSRSGWCCRSRLPWASWRNGRRPIAGFASALFNVACFAGNMVVFPLGLNCRINGLRGTVLIVFVTHVLSRNSWCNVHCRMDQSPSRQGRLVTP
jgi:hypothetical protein